MKYDSRFNYFPKDGDEFTSATARDLGRCSGAQRSYIHSLLDKNNMDEDEILRDFQHYEYDSLRDLTSKEASEIINYLKASLGWN